MVEVELKSWGNSIGVILPSESLKELGLRIGDRIDIDVVNKKKLDGFGLCRKAKPFQKEDEGNAEL